MTDTQRSWGLRALIVLLLAGMVAWLASCTEWAEVEVDLPPRGEAARNRFFATQQLVRRLGAAVATPSSLAQLPPTGASLLLTSWHWDLFPERATALQGWVEQGGHLVIFSDTLRHERLKGWLPITMAAPPKQQAAKNKENDQNDDHDEDDDEVDKDRDASGQTKTEPRAAPPVVLQRLKMPCRATAEPSGITPYYPGSARHYELCGLTDSGWKLQAKTPVLWSLDGPNGPLLLRAAQGQGSVTVIAPWGLLNNERVLKSDNALAAVAALQVRPGSTVWFVAEEARPSLLVWLWQQAWIVVTLAGVALALALWRGARRFGPLAAAVSLARRSMAEQITGTAQFLRQQGPEALLAAQIRALESAARSHVRHYDRLDRSQRAAAIAKHTGLDAAALASAFDKRLARKRIDLPATLELLETARRLLAQKKPAPPTPKTH